MSKAIVGNIPHFSEVPMPYTPADPDSPKSMSEFDMKAMLDLNRRQLLGGMMATGLVMAAPAFAAPSSAEFSHGDITMATISTKDGTHTNLHRL